MKTGLQYFTSLLELVFVACLLLLPVSCITEDDKVDCDSTERKVLLSINLTIDLPQLALARSTVSAANKSILDATPNATLAGEEKIYNICVVTFDANGNRLSYGYYTPVTGTPSYSQTIYTMGAATKIVFVANYLKDAFIDQQTYADFISKVKMDLRYTTSGDAQSMNPRSYAKQTTTLPAYGETSLSGLQPYPNTNAPINLALKHLVSRIYLKSLTVKLDAEYTGAVFKPVSVFMYGYSGYTCLDGSNYRAEVGTAANDSAYMNTGPITVTSTDLAAINAGTPVPSFTGKHLYYVFPNTRTAPTKLVIMGYYYPPGSSSLTFMYYPIRVNVAADGSAGGNQDSYDASSAIHDGTLPKNKAISLDVTIHGAGVLDPSKDILPGTVTVNRTVADWNQIAPSQTIDDKPVSVGMYYYSDGSWGTSATYTDATDGKHPIGLIFSNTTSKADKAAGFTHGYALALTGSSIVLQWATALNYDPLSPVNTPQACYDDKDGFTESQTILHRGALGVITDAQIKANYPAFWYAMTYGTPEQNNTNYAAPLSSSGWYVPSMGQLMSLLENIVGMNMTSIKSNTNQVNGYVSGGNIYLSNLPNLNTKITAAGGTAFGTGINILSSTPCSVNTSNGSVVFNYLFLPSTYYAGFYNWGVLNSTTWGYIRPVIAF